MNLQLSDEQRWLSDAVGELVEREPPERLWQALVDFGALGADLGLVDRALIARALGAALAAVPYVESAAASYALDGIPQHSSTTICLAEPGDGFAPAEPGTTLTDDRLDGDKAGVAFASTVDLLAVSALGPAGAVVALVPPTSTRLTPERSLDPSLQLMRVALGGAEPGGVLDGDLERLAAAAGVLAAADAVGAAAQVFGLARGYASQRRQFGRTIASFQAVRHLLADMYVKTESSWSSALYAAAALDEGLLDSTRTASIAKAFVARATLDVAHGALQVFGGIAFTAEHPAHRYLRRIAARGGQFGTPGEHERRLGRSLASFAESTR
jgi:alkylation response protein AidB-like acyl-CoA dehydrogenase